MVNDHSAAKAYAALQRYAELGQQDTSGDLAEHPELVVRDLICDLSHWLDQNGFAAEQLVTDATALFTEERCADASPS